MELKVSRETLRFERLIAAQEEQIGVEGEATLPGSMRDAVTVLNVQAQAHMESVQAGEGKAILRGQVCFQTLYTQGDLTRIRTMETTCDFEHTVPVKGLGTDMRIDADAAVQETEGSAANGRMTLRALLGIRLNAFETAEKELITDAEVIDSPTEGEIGGLRIKKQRVALCRHRTLGEDKTLVREEFDLPAKLGVGDVLCASGEATVTELTGGAGRVGVCGRIEVRVLHKPKEAGNPLVTTAHEIPFEITLNADIPEGMQPLASAELIDVMADSAADEKRRTLRVEAEVRVRLFLCEQEEKELLEDLYSLSGDALEPVREALDVYSFEESEDARESVRLQITLPKDAPPVDTVLGTFAQPTITGVSPSGRRLDAEGVMAVTIIYLPVDSDIPYSVRMREPFAMTFPIEAGEGISAQARIIETTPAAATSDRVEVRCVVGLHAVKQGVRHIDGVTEIRRSPSPASERGFILVWPARGESRWQTARRLRVAEENLRPAGKGALLAFRK